MDIFIEPVLPKPELIVCGVSPVALALLALGPTFGFSVLASAAAEDMTMYPQGLRTAADYAIPCGNAERYIVVATQGRSDEVALRAALTTPATYRAFVGSRAKTAAVSARMRDVPTDAVTALHAPAGLDLGAITPEEIALSILAQMVAHRRQGQRKAPERP